MLYVDLHTHTTASDGQYSPSELIDRAKGAGIQCLAVTDHDTVDGIEEAVKAGNTKGILVLRGVELGAKEYRYLHILGLGLSSGHTPLDNLCRKLKESRNERKYRIAAFLEEKGIIVPLDEVEKLAGGGIVARPHFAKVMLDHGFVSSIKDAFDRYLDTNEYQRIERFKASAAECIQAIHQSGGKAALAHPYQLNLPDAVLESLIAALKNDGLDAIECYYPQHSPDMVKKYLALAKKFGLHVTAGSDFHGETIHPDNPLTPVWLDIDWIREKSKS